MAASDLHPTRTNPVSADRRGLETAPVFPGERGQSMLETAVFFPILLVFLVGLVQIGLVINAYLLVINAAREGARYGSHDFNFTLQQIASITQTASYPLTLDSSNATIIVTRVKTSTSGGVASVTSYTSEYASGLGSTQASRFSSSEVLNRFSQGAQTNGTDEFIIVEFFYQYPLFIWNANVPMYSYTLMRVIGN